MEIRHSTRSSKNGWIGLAFLLVVVIGVGLTLVRQDATTFEGGCVREYYCANKCPVGAISLDGRGFPVINRSTCLSWDEEQNTFNWSKCGLCLEGCPTKVISFLNEGKERDKHTVE